MLVPSYPRTPETAIRLSREVIHTTYTYSCTAYRTLGVEAGNSNTHKVFGTGSDTDPGTELVHEQAQARAL